jgi:hypothetical protein
VARREAVIDGLLRAAVDADAGGALAVRGQGGLGKTTCAAALLRQVWCQRRPRL